jgi:hypothetical protein
LLASIDPILVLSSEVPLVSTVDYTEQGSSQSNGSRICGHFKSSLKCSVALSTRQRKMYESTVLVGPYSRFCNFS